MASVLFLSLALVAVLLLWAVHYFVRTWIYPSVPPALHNIPMLMPARLIRDLVFSKSAGYDLWRHRYEELGPVVMSRSIFGGRMLVFIAEPDLAQQVLTDDTHFPKLSDASAQTKYTRQFFSNNIVDASGDNWKRLHDVMAPAFRGEMIAAFNRLFGDCCCSAIDWVEHYNEVLVQENPRLQKCLEAENEEDREREGFVVDVAPLMNRLTLDVLGKSVFSFDFGTLSPEKDASCEYADLYHKILGELFSPIRFMFTKYNELPTPRNAELQRNIDRFKGLMMDVIQQRREKRRSSGRSGDGGVDASEAKHADLLDYFIDSDLSDEELKANMNIMFVAGHDTTSTTLSMILNQLALHPHIQDRAREEIQSVLGGAPVPTFEQHKQLKYLTCIIKETLRLFPPVGILPSRITADDVQLGQYSIPKNTQVSVNSLQLHVRPDLWDEPMKYNPDRFLQKTPKNAWIPFGAGKRICLGMNFSLQEQRVFLCALLQRYRLVPGPKTNSPEQQLSGRNFDLGRLLFLHPKDVFVRFVPL